MIALQRLGDEIAHDQDRLWSRTELEYLEGQLAQARRRAQESDPATAIGGLRRKEVEHWERRLERELAQ